MSLKFKRNFDKTDSEAKIEVKGISLIYKMGMDTMET